MGSLRRTIIAGTGTIVAGIAGAWTVFSDKGEQTALQSDENNETTNTSRPANATRGANASRDDGPNHSDLPEAAKQAGKHTGRPPFGFDVVDGYLTPNENYDIAVEIIDRIEKGESKRSTARFAGVSRATIDRILQRRDLYHEQSSG